MLPAVRNFFSRPHHFLKTFHVLITILNLVLLVIVIYTQFGFFRNLIYKVEGDYKEIQQEREDFKANFSEELFNDHLALIEKNSVEASLRTLEEEYSKLTSTESGSELESVSNSYKIFSQFNTALARNNNVKIDTTSSATKAGSWGTLLLNKEFEKLQTEMQEEIKVLDDAHKQYLAALPPPPVVVAVADSGSVSSDGYSSTTVSTSKGKFSVHLIKVALSSVKVKTVSAIKDECSNNCATKTLADYVKDAGGFAGMNGSYFCPPDYSSCAGKTNTFDFALYNSGASKWINKDALTWFKTGLMTFNGTSPSFYSKSSDYGGGGVSAGISNYPSLVKNSSVIVKSEELTSYQKDIKGVRGAIGYDDKYLYLAIISNATVIDAAYVMQTLGANNVLNLDGGGSSAMYIGGKYVVGPGRSLPNAVVLTK